MTSNKSQLWKCSCSFGNPLDVGVCGVCGKPNPDIKSLPKSKPNVSQHLADTSSKFTQSLPVGEVKKSSYDDISLAILESKNIELQRKQQEDDEIQEAIRLSLENDDTTQTGGDTTQTGDNTTQTDGESVTHTSSISPPNPLINQENTDDKILKASQILNIDPESLKKALDLLEANKMASFVDNVNEKDTINEKDIINEKDTINEQDSLPTIDNSPKLDTSNLDLSSLNSSQLIERGLTNEKGEYNCFINVDIQALWHLDSFRRSFYFPAPTTSDTNNSSTTSSSFGHLCNGESSCVYCSLKAIFTSYRYSPKKVLQPNSLRQALATLYKSNSRFQLSEIDDAAEALEAILSKLHDNITKSDSKKNKNKKCDCISHSIFGFETIDQIYCEKCKSSSTPIRSSIFLAYAYTYALLEQYQQDPTSNFSILLKRCSEDDIRRCPSLSTSTSSLTDELVCTEKCKIKHYIDNCPQVFTVGMVWASPDGAEKSDIEKILQMISLEINIYDLFDDINQIKKNNDDDEKKEKEKENEKKKNEMYKLRGMICYYGQHYNCYFYNNLQKLWYVFDDVTVKAIGSDWELVRERCLRGKLQPSVLFYERTKNEIESDILLTDEDIFDMFDMDDFVELEITNEEDEDGEVDVDDFVNLSSNSSGFDEKEEEEKKQDKVTLSLGDFVLNMQDEEDGADVDVEGSVPGGWIYGRKRRFFRFTAEKGFMRVVPETDVIRETFNYDDIEEITLSSANDIKIQFSKASGKAEQEFQQTNAEKIFRLILARKSPEKNIILNSYDEEVTNRLKLMETVKLLQRAGFTATATNESVRILPAED